MPERDSTRRLLRIARAISDREPVAWETELESAPGMSETLERLRRLQTLATVHESAARPRTAGAPARAAEPPRGLVAWGGLEILESLGRGGFGHVYRAWDPLLRREVALKLWRRGADSERLLAEARALARLRHPNLPAVHGADEREGWLGMWTERVSGRTLEERIEREGVLDPREAARVGIEVCRALAAVHEAGLVHRDVKTTNVMRDEAGRIVLLDLGLAVETEAADEAGRAAGTPACMAPEILRGGPATPASDLYGVGVLLYRLVTRAFPYEGRTASEIARRQERGDHVPLARRRPDAPADFVAIVDRALAPSPEAREASPAALEESLRSFLGAATAERATGREPREDLPLPGFLTRFIGRDDELSQCHDALRGHRLVTLVGPAGAGKTRLAVRAAEALAATAPALAFADLSSLGEAAAVEPAVRRALGASRIAVGDSSASLAHAIGGSQLLLVLDNCEHLVSTVAPLAADLLASCPRLTLLATSRAPLGVPGEQVLPVPPLAVPPEDADLRVEALSGYDAVLLFVERACLVKPDFRLTPENASAVAEIARRADGLPLVLELAAARARVLTAEEIRDHMSQGSRLQDRGRFSSAARHASLESAIRWTYDSLSAPQRTLMDGLAIFAGGWTLPAAAAVCAAGVPESEVLEALASLVEQSLVATAPPCLGVTRYRLLDTLRAFALERLRESERVPELERRHFEHYLALAEEAEPRLWGPEQAAWSERLESDHPNLQAALAWAAGHPERKADRLRLAGALARFWTERGHLDVGRRALAAALASAVDADDAVHARALLGAATLAIYQSDHEPARALGGEALERSRRLGDRAGIARTLVTLGIVAHEVSDYAGAESRYRESLDLFRGLGDRRGEAHVLNNLGAITWRLGRWEEARALHREALTHAEPARDPGLRALALTNLGFVARHLGSISEAATCLAEALALVREHRLQRHAASAVEAAAAVLAQRRESARAARLYAAADQHRREIGHPHEPAWLRAHLPMREAAARDLGPERLEAESRAGGTLGLTRAIDEATRGLELVV